MVRLTTKELKISIDNAHAKKMRAIAYLPVGCMEQHGPFLPLETDSLIAEEISADISNGLAGKYFGYVFPAIYYTPSQSNVNFCGTASITDHCFRMYAREVCSAIMNSPFDALVMVAGHAGTESSLREIGFWMVNEQFRSGHKNIRPVFVVSVYEASFKIEHMFKQKPGRHADWREFLLLYHILGEKYFTAKKIQEIKDFHAKNTFVINASQVYGAPMEYRSTEGVLGEPLPTMSDDWQTMSSELWEFLVGRLADRITTELENFWRESFASGQ